MKPGRVVFRFSVNRFKDKLHYHGCGRCRGKYTCSCDMPGMDMNCSRCVGGHPDTTSTAALRPRDCCRTESRTATSSDRDMYKLAGPGPWWMCTQCWRQHPINPRTRTSNA